MKLVIRGIEYEIKDGIAKATLGDLYVLKIKSGMGVQSIVNAFKRLEKSNSHLDLLEHEDGIQALRALIFLCRRGKGEHIDFDEASDVPIQEIGFVADEQDEVGADPKEALTDSDPDDEDPSEPVTT